MLKVEKKMYRTKIKELIKWKLSDKRKPLIFLGARQVGKTWLIQEFGKTEYKQMAYINFEHPDAPKNLFEMDFDTDRTITVSQRCWTFVRDVATQFKGNS